MHACICGHFSVTVPGAIGVSPSCGSHYKGQKKNKGTGPNESPLAHLALLSKLCVYFHIFPPHVPFHTFFSLLFFLLHFVTLPCTLHTAGILYTQTLPAVIMAEVSEQCSKLLQQEIFIQCSFECLYGFI